MSLDEDDGPHLARVHLPDQVAPAPSLQSHDVAAQVLELVRQDAGADQSLEPHVPSPHLVVFALPIVCPEEERKKSITLYFLINLRLGNWHLTDRIC